MKSTIHFGGFSVFPLFLVQHPYYWVVFHPPKYSLNNPHVLGDQLRLKGTNPNAQIFFFPGDFFFGRAQKIENSLKVSISSMGRKLILPSQKYLICMGFFGRCGVKDSQLIYSFLIIQVTPQNNTHFHQSAWFPVELVKFHRPGRRNMAL